MHVLSTERGINEIKARLLEDNVFKKFKRDYPQLSLIQFDINCLDSIKDANGNALSDLRTPEDNEYAADEIHERIRQLTQNDNISLHVSISGGRKTMGFYAGYALSLHGRAQDRLSHVLVEEEFEFITDFFYPTPSTQVIAPTCDLDKDNCIREETILIHELTVKFKTFYSKLREEDYIDELEMAVDKNYFQQAKTQLKKLQARLPLELASKLEIIQDKKRQPFYLDINPESIEFI